MPLSPTAYAGFLGRLQEARAVTGRKMFGGAGLYCEGVFFGIVDDDKLFFKVDDSNLFLYDARESEPWVVMGVAKPYREVPDDVVEDADELAKWIDGAVIVARNRPQKKTKKPKDS